MYKTIVSRLTDLNKKRAGLVFSSSLIFLIILSGGFFINKLFGLFFLLCLLLGILVSFFLGRYWCNWLCLRGSFLEFFVGKISSHKPFPVKVFKNNYLRLFVLLFFLTMLTINITSLSRHYPLALALGMAFLKILVVSTIIAIVLGRIFQARTWCAICPSAFFMKLAALFKPKRPDLMINKRRCTNCGRCAKVCPLQISVYSYSGVVTDDDCIKCGICIENCPAKALSF